MTRIKSSVVLKIVALVFYFLLAFFLAQAQVTSDFSSSADGWTAPNAAPSSGGVLNYVTTGGNPSGHVSATGYNIVGAAVVPVYFYFLAPAKFLGNVSSLYNHTIMFDLQQGTTQTLVSLADVILSNGTTTLYYFSLPSQPATTPAWTSYSVTVNEVLGNWKTSNSATGTAATKDQIKSVLLNLTSFQIRGRFGAVITTGSLDNVVLNTNPLIAPPKITSFTPSSAVAGTAITITGFNFNSTASQNNIYFNGVKVTPSSATATQLVVTAPTSAAYGQLVVENLGTGLQGFSPQSFSPLFDNNKDFGGQIIPASIAQGNKAVLAMSNSGNTFSGMDKGDFDGDGWVDLVTSETQSTTIYVFRNLGVTGTISPASFSAGNILAGLSSIPGGSPNLGPLMVADIDNDGKLDIAAVTSSGGITGYLAVFRNTTTAAGSISFASPQFFSYPYYSAQLSMASGDLDGDGRKDFLYTTGTSPGGIWVNQNLSTPGNVDFSYGFSVGNNFGHTDITSGDLNADGKPEIIASTGTSIEIYQNTSAIGSISVNAPITVPATSGTKVVAADLDADNKLDLVWSGSGAQYMYFSKNIYSGPTFDATSFGSTIQIPILNSSPNPLGIAVSDMNADGKVDVVITGDSNIGIMQNVGTGALGTNSFLAPTLFQGSAGAQTIALISPTIADLDGDNKPEVATVYSNNAVTVAEKGVYIFRNESYPAPRIDTMTPSSGVVGASINFVGDHFSSGLGFPPVYGRLGAIGALIVPSSNTSATATVLPSMSSRFSFTEHGLTAYTKPFNVLFSTNQVINTSSFGTSIDFALTAGTIQNALDIADFDDDGKVDVVVIDNASKIFKNSQAIPGQAITTSSLTAQGTTYSSGYNLIALDIDGDGKLDLNSGGGLLQNTSSGSISFKSVTSTAGGFTTSSSADFNKDGKTDLVFTNGGINVQVFENLSRTGSFTASSSAFQNFGGGAINLTAPSTPFSAVAADFDGDGYDDIISVNPNTNNASYFLNNKIYGRLSASSFLFLGNHGTSGLQPYDVTANDFDGDGQIDIAITYFNSAFVSVLLNNSVLSNISFIGADVPVANKGYKITSQDLDGDGKAEIVVIHQPNPGPGSFTVLKNKCSVGIVNFAATNFPITRNPQAIKVADINSDQKPDILIVANSGTIGNALMVFENKILTPVITITSQPTSVYSVCDGATPIISTAATGTTNITYQWQIFNSGSGSYVDLTSTGGYSNVSTASFTINSTGNFGAGTYRCKISGDFAATVYSNTVSFTVNALPPTPVTSNVNNCGPGSVVLTSSGGSNGQYLWYDQNGLIAGQNNGTYTTPVISSTSFYSVAITDGTCVSPKVNITATILTSGCAPLLITTQPSDFTTCAGNIATFTTAATGTTNIIYQWQFSTGSAGPYSDIVNGGGYANATTQILSVNTTGNFGVGRYRCKIDGDLATTIFTNDEGLFVNPVPAVPTVSNVSNCGTASVTLTASGGSNGNYLWYDSNGLISSQVNSTYLTPVISSTTTYSVAITNGSCNSTKVIVTATINAVPSAPITQGATECPGTAFLLTASGGTNGQYVWYTAPSGGLAIPGEVNSSYTTPTLTTNTTYYVSINNGTCESARSPVTATINTSGCSAPVITTTPLTTEVGGVITLDLTRLITTTNSSLDVNSIVVTKQPSSGAIASVTNGVLTVNYSGVTFSGTDQITIQACDTNGNCSTQDFKINVAGDIVVYNGISPGGKNPALIIEYINLIPETKDNTVHIFDRWQNLVWHGTNYDNLSVVFTGVSDGGSDLPSGVYYYKINFSSGRKTETGFISLRRQ